MNQKRLEKRGKNRGTQSVLMLVDSLLLIGPECGLWGVCARAHTQRTSVSSEMEKEWADKG